MDCQSGIYRAFQNEGEPKECPFESVGKRKMLPDSKTVFWYVLFAANGKATKISDYLQKADIGYKGRKRVVVNIPDLLSVATA